MPGDREMDTDRAVYARASAIWDDRLGTARAQVWRWQLCTAATLLLAALSIVGLIMQSHKARVVAYIVEVDMQGLPRVVTQATETYTVKRASYEAQARTFITNMRALPTDPRVVQANWLHAYHVLTPRAQNLFKTLAQEEPRYKDVGTKVVDVEITRIVAASENTLDVTWNERTLDKHLNTTQTVVYSGLLTFVLLPPKTDEEMRNNPLGIWIDHFNWQRKETF